MCSETKSFLVQIQAALKKKDAGKPLYLVLLCAETSLIALYEDVANEFDKIPETLLDLWTQKTLPRYAHNMLHHLPV